MKNICNSGFLVSSADQKALAEYLLVSPQTWSTDALRGMINKSVKSIMRDWFDIYKTKQTKDIPADYAIVIPAIVAMEEFKPYNTQTPPLPIIDRIEEPIIEIWSGGFNVEDYQKTALDAFYSDPEEMLRYFMHNKIHARRKAFVKMHEQKFFQSKEAIPARQDSFINLVCGKVGYKNRSQNEAEIIS